MPNIRSITRPLRAISLLAIIAIVVGGVTFAALRSQNNYVTGSRMTSASASLTIAKIDNGQWYTTLAGYDFFDLAPGGEAGPKTGNHLYFRNDGSTDLDLRIGINPSRLSNPNGVMLQKAHIVITDDNGAVLAEPSLAQLIDANALGNTLPLNLTVAKNTSEHLRIKMRLDDGAFPNTSQASLENIDLIFSGVAQNL